MTKCEMETTITYDKEQQLVRLFSAIPKDQRKVERLGFKPTYGTVEHGFGYQIPLDQFTWRVRLPKDKRIRSSNHGNLGGSRARKGIPDAV